MTIAQMRLKQITNKNHNIKSIIRAISILFKLPALTNYDETHDNEHVNTFIFTFEDDSALKIDMDGNVYLDDDYQNSHNIFN